MGTRTQRFVCSRAKRYLAFNIVQREVTIFMGLHQNLAKTRRRLGAKLVTDFDVTSRRAITSHVRCRTVNHGRRAAAMVESTRLRVHKNFFCRLDSRNGIILQKGQTGLQLVCHLLLHKNIYSPARTVLQSIPVLLSPLESRPAKASS
jgi:hypothetical protein